MIYYRDPLLDTICDKIAELDRPAYIKNSELVYVAVNDAYARLFDLDPADLTGTGRGEYAEVDALVDLEDKERACLVFGEDQRAIHSDPFGKGRFSVELERFTLADAQSFVYGVFNPQPVLRASEFSGPQQVPELPKAAPGGTLSGDLAEYIIDNMVAGICVYDQDDRLLYFNSKLDQLYSPLIGPLRVGMRLEEVLNRIADDNIRRCPDDPELNAATREAWVAERVALQKLPLSMDLMPLSDGKWLQCINRRLPSGVFVGLRVDVTEMKEQEALLKKHVEDAGLYRELLNRLPVAAFARGPDQRLHFVNQAYSGLFGRSYEELIGTDEFALLGEHAREVWEKNRDTLERGIEYEQEEETPVAGGRLASTIVKTGRMVSAAQKPYVVGTVIDISAIRQRELQLKEANERAEALRRDLENIVSAIDVGLIVLDSDLNIQLMNQAYQDKIWASARERWQGEIIGRPYRDLLRNSFESGQLPTGGFDFDAIYERHVEELRNNAIKPHEVVLNDGTAVFFSSMSLTDGRFLLCCVDLTELRKRDLQVVEAHEEADRAYKLVLSATDTMPEGLMVLEGDAIVLTNRSLAPLLNVREEIFAVGQTWEAAYRETLRQNRGYDPDMEDVNAARFREAIANRKDLSYDFPLNDGRWIHLEMRAKDNGQTVIICSDETRRFQREEELKRLILKAEAADRAKSEFLANMSHEIRTPMNGILGMAELLSKSALDTRQKTFTDIIMKSGSALLTIINDILDFSRLDAGQMQLKIAPFDPLEAVEDVATLLASRAAEKDIELIIRRAGDVPATVNGDAGRFRQIVTNLLGNAVKFTESGHVVAMLAASPRGEGGVRLDLTVEDTGIGIPADKLDTIFKQFSQVDSSSTRRHEGTGLGLAISERLARLQGGTISVTSTEGVGSVFTVSLPFQAASTSSRRRPLPVNVEGARVLVIDDNDINRAILIEQIAEWGFEGVAAPDGETGLAILDAALGHDLALDLVILDCQMPGMNGATVARRIRLNPAHDRTAIVFLTSVDIVDTDENLVDLKIQAHLMKPARSAILRDTMIEVIRGVRTRSGAPQAPSRAASSDASNAAPVGPQPASPASLPSPIVALPVAPMAVPGPGRTLQGDVLVAEDNEVNRIVFSQILDATGIGYRIVANGAEAIEAWQRARPSIILMDVSMPVMNGLQATVEIRRLEAETGEHVPIVGVTSHALDGDREMCLSSGMDDYITKPISPERLEEKIRHWTGLDDVEQAGSSRA